MRRILLTLCFAAAAAAQPSSFHLLPASASPTPRFDGTLAYDAAGQQILLFGGEDDAPRNDLWSYSLIALQWTRLDPAGTPPPARFGHTAIFDVPRRRLIVFAGQAGRGFFSDVWAFDPARNSWQQLARDEAGPSRRYGHSAVYDAARHRMVISHGFTDAGRFDDTWAFDLSANTWSNLTPAGTKPLRRCLHHAAIDDNAGQMYLYGGCASGFGPCPLGDLWRFDLASAQWTELRAAPAPPAREHYGMAFDTTRAKLIIHGGQGDALLSDTWEFTPATGQWQRAAIAGDAPPARQRHEAVAAAGSFYFFGGLTDSGPVAALWSLSLGLRVENAFSGATGAVAPGELVRIYSKPPVTIDGVLAAALAEDSDSQIVQIPATATDSATIVAGPVTLTLPVRPAVPGLAPVVTRASNEILVLYATGLNADPPELRIGGISAALLYAGPAPGLSGVSQLNAIIPSPLPPGEIPISVTTAGVSSREIRATLALQ